MQTYEQDSLNEPLVLIDEGFYHQYFKRDLNLYFVFFLVWSMWVNAGRVVLQCQFALEYGIILDSNLVSRIMKDLELHLTKKKRVESISFSYKTEELASAHNFTRPVAETNLEEFNYLADEDQETLLEIVESVGAGETLSDIQDRGFNSYSSLSSLGKRMKSFVVRKISAVADEGEPVCLALDEKVVEKSFDPTRHPDLSMHYVSRRKTYLPSIVVEVAAVVRRSRLGEIVGHYFPYPQQNYDHRNRRQPLRKHVYLKDFLQELWENYGHLTLLADANYATQKLVTWFKQKNWDFIMRVNPNQKKLLEPFQKQFDKFDKFDKDNSKDALHWWVYQKNFGGWVRILAYRHRWKDAQGKPKEKRYFLITTLEGDAKEIWRLYRLRWNIENSFKALTMLDRLPGLKPERLAGFFALAFYVIAPLCFQSQSQDKTVSKLLRLKCKRVGRRVSWEMVPSHLARKLLKIGLHQSTELTDLELRI
jgi:hypothetical protein